MIHDIGYSLGRMENTLHDHITDKFNREMEESGPVIEKPDHQKEDLKRLGIRFLITLPFFSAGLFLMLQPLSLLWVVGFLLILFSCLLLMRPLFAFMPESLGSFYFPTKQGNEVNLMFSIVDTKIMHQEYDEALKQLKKMIPEDPERLEIYMRIMKLAVNHMKQPGLAKDALHVGLQNLTNLRKRKKLAYTYKELINP